jgi:hypothetical protein
MELFDEADINKDGLLSIEEITSLIRNKASQYPQLKLFAKRIAETYYKFDKNRLVIYFFYLKIILSNTNNI